MMENHTESKEKKRNMDSVRNKGYIFIQEVPNDGKSQ